MFSGRNPRTIEEARALVKYVESLFNPVKNLRKVSCPLEPSHLLAGHHWQLRNGKIAVWEGAFNAVPVGSPPSSGPLTHWTPS